MTDMEEHHIEKGPTDIDLLDAYNAGYQRGYKEGRKNWCSLALHYLDTCRDKLVKMYNEGDLDETDN